MRTSTQARQFYNSLDVYEIGSRLEGWQVPQLLVRNLAPLLCGGELVLDVGCGPGFVGQELQQSEWQGTLIGVDIAEKRLKEAAVKLVYRGCAHANAYRLPFPNKKFDVVVSSAMVGLTGPKSITEMQRLVKMGGVLACAIGEIKSIKWCTERFRECRAFLNKIPNAKLVLKKDLGGGYRDKDFNDEHYVLYIFRCL